MGRSLGEDGIEWHDLAVRVLLSHASRMATDIGAWTRAELGAAFLARVRAGEDPLGDHYSATHSSEERRGIGATLTPMPLVHAMIEWAKRQAASVGDPVRIVDCGAGTGRFAVAAARRFPSAQIIAVENDPTMGVLLRANINAAALSRRIEVIPGDFRSIHLGDVAGATLFIGNPPYVRHHQIGREWKDWYVNLLRRQNIKASQLAGLHLHFFAKVSELATKGDFGCFITAAEWLDVGYGSALKVLLSNVLGGSEIHILEPTAEAFPGTMATTSITCFRVGQRTPDLRIRRVRKLSELSSLTSGRKISWERANNTAKWSLLIYRERKPERGTIELGELCRVHRGQVTGNNRIWIAGAHTKEIPGQFLKPTITRAQELIEAEPLLADDHSLARVVDLPMELDEIEGEDRASVERFIRWAQRAGAAEGYIAKHRKPWWAIRLGKPAPIVCTYMARRPPAFVRNRVGARLLNIAHGIFPREELAETSLSHIIQSLRVGATRDYGRTYSGGLTKFEPKEIERIPISWPPHA